MRPLARTLAAFLLTLVVAYLLGSIVQTILNGGDIVSAVLDETWRVVFTGGLVSIGLILLFWLVVNVAARRRGSGVLFWVNAGALIVAIVIGALVTLATGVFVAALSLGLEALSPLGTVLAAGELFAGGLIALAIVHFALLKSDPAAID